MTGGPFRDTLTPLIDDARRQLAELRRRRGDLEARYGDARKRLDQKTPPPPPDLRWRDEENEPPPPPGVTRKGFIAGLLVGLITWLPLLQHAR